MKPLVEVCDIVSGSTPSRKKKEFWTDGTVPWFTVKDIRSQGREIESTLETITSQALEQTSINLIPEGSVLLCCTASVGEYALSMIPMTFNQQFNGLIPKPYLNARFLMHWCSTLKVELLKLSGKATVDFISQSKLKALHIPIPPLDEQERIVEVLDEAFASIDKAKANIERNLINARELFQSRLNDIFSNPSEDWVVKPLGEVCDLQNGFAFKSKEYVEDGVRILRNKNVSIGILTESDWVCYPKESRVEYDRFLIDEGDFVISMDRPIISDGFKFFWFSELREPLLLNQRVLRIKPKSEIGDVLNLFFQSDFFASKISPGKSIGVPHISMSDVAKVTIAIPRHESGLEIIKRVSSLQVECNKMQQNSLTAIDNLEKLRQSILEQAFEGKLTKTVAA